MRIYAVTAVLLCAVPAVAQEARSTSDVFAQALRALPQHVRSLSHETVAAGDDMGDYAIADTTIAGAEQSFAESAADLHNAATAEALLASYREVTRGRIEQGSVKGMRVLALDEFATSATSYDWERLNQKYPHVKAIMRISAPAIAGSYALVRVEMIGPAGPAWGNFLELERQPDGSWQHTRAVAGDLWN